MRLTIVMTLRFFALTSFIAAGLIIGATSQNLSAENDVSKYKPPSYQLLRQAEDWSVLAKREPSQPSDFFDPIKYIPLNQTGSIWLSFGGQVRERVEAWNNFNFGEPPAADDSDLFLLSRFLYHIDLHLGEYLRFFAQGKSAFSTDRDLVGGRRDADADELDLQNAFIDVMLPLFREARFTFRVGRQEMLFGKQRLVSPGDWSNVRRTFDGLSGILKYRSWTVTCFWTQLVIPRKYDFNRSDANTDFFGIYAAGKVPKTWVGIDLYWLGLEKDAAAFNDTAGREMRHSLGGRLFGKIPRTGLDFELEGAYQLGELGDGDIDAFMFTSQLGYSFADLPGLPYLYLAFDYASGDSQAGDDEVETFNKLFPTGHAHLGYIDIVGRQNIIDLRSGVSFKPLKKLGVALDWHQFWRADDDDALYNPAGIPLRPGAAGSSSEIGAELDVTLKYQLDRHTLIQFGYSHFFPGDFIEESGASDDVDFLYLMPQFTF